MVGAPCRIIGFQAGQGRAAAGRGGRCDRSSWNVEGVELRAGARGSASPASTKPLVRRSLPRARARGDGRPGCRRAEADDPGRRSGRSSVATARPSATRRARRRRCSWSSLALTISSTGAARRGRPGLDGSARRARAYARLCARLGGGRSAPQSRRAARRLAWCSTCTLLGLRKTGEGLRADVLSTLLHGRRGPHRTLEPAREPASASSPAMPASSSSRERSRGRRARGGVAELVGDEEPPVPVVVRVGLAVHFCTTSVAASM